MTLSLGHVYRDAWQVYRLLMKRSVATAAIVFALVDLVDFASRTADGTARILLGFAAFAAGLAGPVIVQGALVEIVRNIHEGRKPEGILDLLEQARRKFWSLLLASVAYGLSVILGLLCLVVPGLLVIARKSLLAPLIMLEGQSAVLAWEASSQRVRGRTMPVLLIVVATFVLLNLPFFVLAHYLPGGAVEHYGASFVWSSLTAPFDAHVLTVIYYRLTDPERPIVHEDVFSWRSVWDAG